MLGGVRPSAAVLGGLPCWQGSAPLLCKRILASCHSPGDAGTLARNARPPLQRRRRVADGGDAVQLNALSMEADFDILDDPFVQPLQSGAVKPPASFTPTAAAAPPMAAASLSKSGPDVISCPIPTDESDNLDGIIWPPPPSPPGRPHATQPPPTQTASRDTSSSGPALVPTPSCQSFDQYARPAASEDPPAPPPAGAAGAAQPTSSSSAVVMPMPVQMPMQPFAPWQFMDMFLPMQHMCQPWLAYIPASLTPKGDDAVHKEALAARRAKRDRFQQKKRELSCRKTVRYASRKRYADSRPRVNGRFISKAATAAAVAAATAVTVSDESA